MTADNSIMNKNYPQNALRFHIYIRGAFNKVTDFFVLAFRIVVDS